MFAPSLDLSPKKIKQDKLFLLILEIKMQMVILNKNDYFQLEFCWINC